MMKMYLEAKNEKKSFEKTKHLILKNKTKPQMKVVNMFIIPIFGFVKFKFIISCYRVLFIYSI